MPLDLDRFFCTVTEVFVLIYNDCSSYLLSFHKLSLSLASDNFCHLLIIFANSLNIGGVLDPNSLVH